MEQFMNLVKAMRDAQKEFLNSKTPSNLKRKINLEMQVDRVLMSNNVTARCSCDQPELFTAFEEM